MSTLTKKALTKRVLGTLLALGALGVVGYASTKETPLKSIGANLGRRGGGGAPGSNDEPPAPVLVGEAKIADIPVSLEGVGTVRALNTVTVKSLVEGKILKFNFNEGDTVKKGDVLAEIDPTTYQAALDQVVAKQAVDQTQLSNAQKDLERYAKMTTGVIAQKTIDTQEALVRQLTAQVKSDAAAVASAQAILDYTKVIAPITGRTGLRLIDAGNVVRTADAAGLVVLTQVQPIAVVFTLPQQQLQQVTKAMAAGAVVAEAMDGDNKVALDRGVLQVVDNQVDQTTGTIKLKAEFPNANTQLWPGQFVNLRVLVDTLKQVVVVPTPAVQRGPTGTYVFVASGDNTVSQRPVTVGLQNDAQSVVTAGVAAGDRVVTTGFSRLKDGARVSIGGGAPKGENTPAKGVIQPSASNGEPSATEAGERRKGSGRRSNTQGRADAKGVETPAKSAPQ